MTLPEALRLIVADEADVERRVAETLRDLLVSLELYSPADLEGLPAAAIEALGGREQLAAVLAWRRRCITARFAGQPVPVL